MSKGDMGEAGNGIVKISKAEAARSLLDSATRALLDDRDYVAAIVLGGAAEDVYQDLLDRDGRLAQAARQQMVGPVMQVYARLAPERDPLTEKQAFDTIRFTYNWLRHNDKKWKDEPQVIEVALVDEAHYAVKRAIENLFWFAKVEHPRVFAVVESHRRVTG
jgi:hypothetical protein